MLARLTQGGRELLVLGDGLGELALGLEQSLLEGADALGGVLQPPAEDDDLFLEALDRLLELVDLPPRTRPAGARARKPCDTSWGVEIAWRRTLHRAPTRVCGTFDDGEVTSPRTVRRPLPDVAAQGTERLDGPILSLRHRE